jgi:rhodanese-related sulfurtransferase
VLSRLFRRPGGIDADEAARRLRLGEIVLIDVRDAREWRSGRAKGAKHVPLGAVPQKMKSLAAQGKPVAFICRSGNRSATACSLARKQGLEALNVRGGMGAWKRAGLPVTRG